MATTQRIKQKKMMDRGVITQNKNVLKTKSFIDLEFENNSVSSEESLEDSNTSKNELPFKKRFGAPIMNKHSEPLMKIKQNHLYAREEEEKHFGKSESKKADILPGVIRHTSCPKSTLAFYYHYSMN